MTEYVVRRERLKPGDVVDIPDNARDVNVEHGDEYTVVSYLEKRMESVL